MLNRRGQTILEYTVILIIILGVMIAMKDYVKRGVQGRWKSASDDFGDQYDPRFVNSSILYKTQVNSESIVSVSNAIFNGERGQWTGRVDMANTIETKAGNTQIGE